MPRHEAPRHVGLVEPATGQTLGSWGTAKGRAMVEVRAWPQRDRARRARQAHSVKRLRDHGALKTNEGRTKIRGVDRPPQRAREQRAHALAAAQQRLATQGKTVTTQQATGVASTAKGQGKRLEPRQRTVGGLAKAYKDAQHKHGQLAADAAALGPPGERAERAFRPQTLLTIRTLL